MFGAHNSIRIPPFVSLDARLAKQLQARRKSDVEVYLDVQNVTDHANPEEIVYNPTYTQRGYITGFPILPVIGARLRMVRTLLRAAALGAVVPASLVAAMSCKPNLDETVSLVTTPQVLGVQATPAEGAPSSSVTFTALVVDPSGELDSLPIAWDFCNARNPLANLGPVSTECSQPDDPNLAPMGDGPQATGVIPDIACRDFGPEVPPTTGNATPGRPVDPDSTGGYYQPVSLFVPTSAGTSTSIYGARIACGLAEGTSEQVSDFLGRYHVNVNPAITSLSANGTALAPGTGGATSTLAAGQKVTLEVSWAECPLTDSCGDGLCGPDEDVTGCPVDCTTPQGCSGAERYVSFDLGSQSLVDAREGMHVSWFATAGSFDLDRTGRDGSDTTTTSDDGWTPPGPGQAVHLWVVLRDDRGGTGWAGYVIQTQ